MFKQLEELQRQKKLQELHDSRQQNVINRQSLIHNKQASGTQYAPLVNGTPVRDPSQMFMFGNTNLAHGFQNGLSYSQAQNQVLHSMGLPSQPIDGHSFSRFSHFHGPTRESTGEQVDTISRSCISDQFNVSYQGQEQNIINHSQEFSTLDPLEQKFLFSSDDENLGNLGNMFEENDNLQGFPSVQSGSWSALMQSALEETSSTDTGVQEEWSGLSFQNPEHSNDNQNSNLMEIGKNPTLWQNNIFQNAPSLNSNAQVQRFSPLQVNQGSSRHAAEFEFVNDALNSSSEFKKGFLPDNQRISNNSSAPQYFGLRSGGPSSQRPPVNYFDLSQISQQSDTSHLVQLKDQDVQRSSTIESQHVCNSIKQPNVWVDIPSHQNLSGIYKAPNGSPSTSDVANSRIETASEAPKESNDLLEISGHVLNSQGFDYAKGQDGKIPFEEESLNTVVMNEKVDSEIEVPQLTSMSQLTSVYENYKTMLLPSATIENQLVKKSTHPPLQDASHLLRNSLYLQMNLANTSQYESVWPATGTRSLAVNQDLLVSQSKKRKFPTYELLPWHKEATKGSSRLHDMSIAELEWAQAAKRVPEKLKEEAEALTDSPSMVHSKKRIMLTTQLMQLLFGPAPASILSEKATSCYDTVTYFSARLAVGDACSLANHSHTPCDISDSLPGKAAISKRGGDQNLSKIVEDFINRAKTLEDELLRLENKGSVLEIRMESQDLERFSMINRFAKFHSRGQMVVAAETGSSGGGSTLAKLYPQRYVTASQMPRIVPQGHNCLSL